jgi:hypothetical protein
VTGDLIIIMDEGNNVVNLDHVYLAGNLTVAAASGDHIVVFGATGVVSAMGNCEVTSGRGNDLFRAEPYKAFFGGSLLVTDDYSDGAVSLIGAWAAMGIRLHGTSQALPQGVTSGGQLAVQSDSLVNNIAIFTSAATDKIRVTTPSGQNSIYIDTCYSPAGVEVHAYSLFISSGFPPPSTPITTSTTRLRLPAAKQAF